MEEKINFRRITAGLPVMDMKEAFVFKDGKGKWNEYWAERMHDYQMYFSNLLEDSIDEAIGARGWSIDFVPEPIDEPHFTAKIYVNNPDHYFTVLAMIKEKVSKDIKVDFNNGGAVPHHRKKKE